MCEFRTKPYIPTNWTGSENLIPVYNEEPEKKIYRCKWCGNKTDDENEMFSDDTCDYCEIENRKEKDELLKQVILDIDTFGNLSEKLIKNIRNIID